MSPLSLNKNLSMWPFLVVNKLEIVDLNEFVRLLGLQDLESHLVIVEQVLRLRGYVATTKMLLV